MEVMLHGELGAILAWLGAEGVEKAAKTKTPGGFRAGVSESLVAGAGFHHYLHPEQAMMVAGMKKEISSYLSTVLETSRRLSANPDNGLFAAQA